MNWGLTSELRLLAQRRSTSSGVGVGVSQNESCRRTRVGRWSLIVAGRQRPSHSKGKGTAEAVASSGLRTRVTPGPPPSWAADEEGPDSRHASGDPERRDAFDSPVFDAVVKVYCTHTEPNFSLPWQKKHQYSSTSSGFCIPGPGRRILTNAHCTEHHTQVKVKRRGDDIKYVAQVLAIGTECDIALLEVADPAFWVGIEPLELGPLPTLQDAVAVVGYPVGGDTISVTTGVVSRIEVTPYAHGGAELLGIQIDAAINGGNSGGPVFNERGQVAGIAFQSLKSEDTEGIGYVIPPPVIRHFLRDVERHGKYTGFPRLGVKWQALENPSLRAALTMRPDQKGVLITRVEPTAPAASVIQPGDVITEFDGIAIANDGTAPFRTGERINFAYFVSQKFTDERTSVTILRRGELQRLDVVLGRPTQLVPQHINGQDPSYLIVGGVVFTPVCEPYLRAEYGEDFAYDSPVDLLRRMVLDLADVPSQQVVIISQVLAADVNIGYEETSNTQVLNFNGRPVVSLSQLAQLVASCEDRFLRFELDRNELVVLDREVAMRESDSILRAHGIPASASPDILAALSAVVPRVPGGALNGVTPN